MLILLKKNQSESRPQKNIQPRKSQKLTAEFYAGKSKKTFP